MRFGNKLELIFKYMEIRFLLIAELNASIEFSETLIFYEELLTVNGYIFHRGFYQDKSVQGLGLG